MHTVIREPEPEYRASTEKLIRYSEKLVVMSQTAVDMLKDVYKVPDEKKLRSFFTAYLTIRLTTAASINGC